MQHITPEVIINDGWQFFESCRCGGILKYKYINTKHRNSVLEWWVKYDKFKILNGGKTIKEPTKLSLLEDYLKEYK